MGHAPRPRARCIRARRGLLALPLAFIAATLAALGLGSARPASAAIAPGAPCTLTPRQPVLHGHKRFSARRYPLVVASAVLTCSQDTQNPFVEVALQGRTRKEVRGRAVRTVVEMESL